MLKWLLSWQSPYGVGSKRKSDFGNPTQAGNAARLWNIAHFEKRNKEIIKFIENEDYICPLLCPPYGMIKNPIHKTQRENTEKLNFSIDAIYQQFRELEKKSRLKQVSLPPKQVLKKAS